MASLPRMVTIHAGTTIDDLRRDYNDHNQKVQFRRPVINMITRGPTTAGTLRKSRKAYAQMVMHIVGD